MGVHNTAGFQPNSLEGKLLRAIAVAEARGLTIHGFVIKGKEIRILTQPVAGIEAPQETEAERWLRENG